MDHGGREEKKGKKLGRWPRALPQTIYLAGRNDQTFSPMWKITPPKERPAGTTGSARRRAARPECKADCEKRKLPLDGFRRFPIVTPISKYNGKTAVTWMDIKDV